MLRRPPPDRQRSCRSEGKDWLWAQSRANPSLLKFPCYTGKYREILRFWTFFMKFRLECLLQISALAGEFPKDRNREFFRVNREYFLSNRELVAPIREPGFFTPKRFQRSASHHLTAVKSDRYVRGKCATTGSPHGSQRHRKLTHHDVGRGAVHSINIRLLGTPLFTNKRSLPPT